MQLPVVTFSTLLQRMAASVQGAATALVDLSVGSVLRATLEASASVALWMQFLVLQVLTATRAATSNGPDLDSWMADFSLARLPGAAAQGIVTFSRYTTGIVATIPVGASVSTSDGSQSFVVIEQDSNPAWTGSGYTVGVSQASVDVPVQASVTGTAANVRAGAIGRITTPIAGIDQASNAAPFSGGIDAETDSALRARFTLYINSRTAATVGAVKAAIAGLQPGLRFAVFENQDPAGNCVQGMFSATVDDGSGYPNVGLLSAASTAVDAVRPVGARFAVSAPTPISVAVNVTVVTVAGANRASIEAAIGAAITSWITSLPIGGTLAVSKIDALAHMASTAVTSVSQSLINGQPLDVTAPPNGVLLPVAVVVS